MWWCEIVEHGGCWNHTLLVREDTGTVLAPLPSGGEVPDDIWDPWWEYHRPYDVAVDSSDRVYVSEWGTHSLSVFTSEGQFLTSFGSSEDLNAMVTTVSHIHIPGAVTCYNMPWIMKLSHATASLPKSTKIAEVRVQGLNVRFPLSTTYTLPLRALRIIKLKRPTTSSTHCCEEFTLWCELLNAHCLPQQYSPRHPQPLHKDTETVPDPGDLLMHSAGYTSQANQSGHAGNRSMEVDTGAAVSIISETACIQRFSFGFVNIHRRGHEGCWTVYSQGSLQATEPPGTGRRLQRWTTSSGEKWLKHIHLDWPLIAAIYRTTHQTRHFMDVFAMKSGPSHLSRLSVAKDTKPKFHRDRPVPFALKWEGALDHLEADGILEKVSHSEWAAPIMTVPKKDRCMQLCGDYSQSCVGCSQVSTQDSWFAGLWLGLWLLLHAAAAY